MLILDTSIASLKEELGRDVRAMALAGAILVIGMLAGIGLILRELVLRRLSALASAARSLAAGKLQHRVEIEGNDQITVLGTEFNNMADSLTRLLAEVRREQTRLENIMNGVGDSLFVLDRDLRIVAANEAFMRRPDLAGESVLGRSCCDVANKGSSCCPENNHCLGVKCFTTEQPQRGTIISPTVEGERVWDVHTSPIFDEDGTLTQVVEVWRDITDRMREEMQLAEFERLTSLGMLASGFSHEMNTPLASMLLSVDRILEKIEDEEGLAGSDDNKQELKEYAEIVRTEILRCTKITNQFLRFSRGQQFSVELVDINQVVEAVVPLVLPTARENGVSVEVGPARPMPMTRANYGLMQQVLLNLLINAVQSCGEGDKVEVSCRANADVRIITEDSGSGIPQEELRQIFEPFYSRRPAGTGLGLFLSLSMVRRFGGDISVDSKVGKGSRFEIVLPIPEENAP
jgi:PAS domain S-box-containing protein